MSNIGISNSVLNQKQSPALYQDLFANRPAAGFLGRLFVATDTSQIFADTGTSWVLIANSGIGSTGTLQVVTTNGNTTDKGISITSGGLATNAAQVTGLTQNGGILFTDGSGNFSQDVNLNWDSTNNYMGIGQTGTPTAPLDIHNSTVGVQIQLNATSTNNSTIAFQNASVGKWRVGNLYSAGANLFHIYNNSLANNAMTISAANAATFTGSVTASSLIKSGGTSSQFLKADGSVDSSSYITLSSLSATTPLSYNSGTGVFTILVANTSQSGYLTSTDWNTFNNKAGLASFSASSPLSYNSGTGAFSIQVANSGQSGYLTSTDWNTFNNKQSTITTGNLTEATSSVLTITGGTGAVIGTGTSIAVNQASGTQSGYLSSTDWTTFNSKQSQINGTGFVKASGTTISYDNSTYYLASNPSNYITLASLSGTTPISYNNGTGAISIAQSSTSSSGYLSSTDWNTFNSKASLTAFSASPPLSYNSGTGAFSITQASGSTNGYLSSTDWTTFNNKQSALTNPVTGTGTSNTIVKFNGTTTVTNSLITDDGTTIQATRTTGNLEFGLTAGNTSTAGNPSIALYSNTGLGVLVPYGTIQVSPDAAGNTRAAKMVFATRQSGGTLADALTINSSQAATFSSSVTANGTGTFNNDVVINATTGNDAHLQINRLTTSNDGLVWYKTNSVSKWILGLRGLATDDFYLYNFNTGSNNLTVSTGGAATFSGSVQGGNFGVNCTAGFVTATDALTINVTSGGNNQLRLTDRSITSSYCYQFYNASTGEYRIGQFDGGIGISFYTGNPSNTEKVRINTAGNLIVGNSGSDNGQGRIQNTGGTFTGGLEIGGLTFSTNTTANTTTTFYFFNGGAGVTLTLPDTNGHSSYYVIKNYSANALTIGRTGTNVFIAAGATTTVTSLTLAAGASTIIIGNGTINYVQIV